jgi:hypothetical protein
MKLHREWPAWAVAVLIGTVLAATAGAEPDAASVSTLRTVTPTVLRKPIARPRGVEGARRTFVESSSRRIDVNNINMFVTNLGSWANDFANQNNSGLFFPKGTTKTAVYESGLWVGAKVAGVPLATIAEYSQEYGPGAMVGNTFDDASRPEYQVYKVVRFTGDPADTDHVEHSAAAVAADRTLDPVIHHSWSEYIRGAAPYGAPTRMYDLPDPANPGSTIQVEGPDVSGDQMLWAVYNDADASRHQNKAGKSAPLGLEIQQSTFAFNRQGALGNTVFLRFKIINKGGQNLDSMFVSLWADPDLGGAGDDLVGCDTLKSLGYVYNATNTDQLYADRPPAVGYDFFQGPKQGATELGLASFDFYINGKDPLNAAQTYNLMKGLNADGTTVDTGPPGANPVFYASGDPVAGTGWLDTNPADRRFLMSAGPFSMANGDTQIVVGAIVIAQGGDRLSSITGMKFFDIKAQKAYDIAFQLPPPPPQPKVTYSTDHGSINLAWDSGSRFNYTPDPGYAFEGYVVYQGASVSGPWKRLRVFDLVNDIKDVRDSVFDVVSGLVVHDTPVAFGGDNGVQYTYSTTQDAIRGGTLKDGQKYYFAVTAYAVNQSPPIGFDKVLENSFAPIPIVVQRPASGTDVSAAYVNGSTVHRVSNASPPTTDHIAADIVDPSQITGHTYAITYSPAAGHPWTLTDLNTGQALLTNQTERTDSPSYAPVDGMTVKLRESKSSRGPLNDIYYTPFDLDNPFQGIGAGLGSAASPSDLFDDSFGYAWDFFAGVPGPDPDVVPADSFSTVELRFGQTQQAYIYYRDELPVTGGAPGGDRKYPYGGIGTVPFQAWDTDRNVQLAVGFVERRVTDATHTPVGAQPGTQDGTWMPDGSDLGGREYLAISHRAYSTTPIPELATDNAIGGSGTSPGGDDRWNYAAWLHRVGNIKAGDKFVIQAGGNVTGTENDSLIFTTSGPLKNQVALQKSSFDKIRVVPNPYYAHSTYELSSLNRIVKFINMPESATIRIYNLAGDVVRTLRKTDQSSSIIEWDLLSENRLPVASGVYVYHIDVPGAGQTMGKMVIFMEKERLSNL